MVNHVCCKHSDYFLELPRELGVVQYMATMFSDISSWGKKKQSKVFYVCLMTLVTRDLRIDTSSLLVVVADLVPK